LSGEPDLEAYPGDAEPIDIIHLLNEASGPFVADGAFDDKLQVFIRGSGSLVIAPYM